MTTADIKNLFYPAFIALLFLALGTSGCSDSDVDPSGVYTTVEVFPSGACESGGFMREAQFQVIAETDTYRVLSAEELEAQTWGFNCDDVECDVAIVFQVPTGADGNAFALGYAFTLKSDGTFAGTVAFDVFNDAGPVCSQIGTVTGSRQ